MAKPSTVARLDRRVRLSDGSEGRLSSLYAHPRVVLLGEPGSGKSTALASVAGVEGNKVMTARSFIHSTTQPPQDGLLLLDGLDEYRSDGPAGDKLEMLAQRLEAASCRWWLGCRAQDWRDADEMRLGKDGAIVVAQLLPLDQEEAAAVLTALGEPNPGAFIERAVQMGGRALLATPLSVKLLYTAVADNQGTWPATRHDLYGAATKRLAHEDNVEHRRVRRTHSVDQLLDAAGAACLVLLAAGAQALWCTDSPPPFAQKDAREYVAIQDLALSPTLRDELLNTALFRGDGNAFEPMHRTVAEFLAARALAKATRGAPSVAAFPLRRAVAMISDGISGPPTELRGLFSWMAVHLAQAGDDRGATRLVAMDAVGCLLYGDAASLGIPARRVLLHQLPARDPQFLLREDPLSMARGETNVGALAGEDLMDEFEAVLAQTDDTTHTLLTVLECLARGRPIATLRPRLRQMVLDPTRPSWHRLRALEAWLNGCDDIAVGCREFYNLVSKEPVSIAREQLRIDLAKHLLPMHFRVGEVRQLLDTYSTLSNDNTIGRLGPLRPKLDFPAATELLESPLALRRPHEPRGAHESEIRHLLEHVLIASLPRLANHDGPKLWRWLINISARHRPRLEFGADVALTAWLGHSIEREASFFLAIVDDPEQAARSAVPAVLFASITHRPMSDGVVAYLVDEARSRGTHGGSLWGALSDAASRELVSPADYWILYDALDAKAGPESSLTTMTVCSIDGDDWLALRLDQERERSLLKAEREQNVRVLTPVEEQLRTGGQVGLLNWAAENYLNADSVVEGQQRVRTLTNDALALAITAGWKTLAAAGPGYGAGELSSHQVKGSRHLVTYPVLVGLEVMIDLGEAADMRAFSATTAIVALLHVGVIRSDARRRAVRDWAVARLELEPMEGARLLEECWLSAIDDGASDLREASSLLRKGQSSRAVTAAVKAMLQRRPSSMDGHGLFQALQLAASQLPRSNLRSLCAAVFGRRYLRGSIRATWLLALFELDPCGYANDVRTLVENEPDLVVDLQWQGLTQLNVERPAVAAATRLEVVIEILGPRCGPDDITDVHALGHRSNLCHLTRNAVRQLSANLDEDAARAMNRLVDLPSLSQWRDFLRHARETQLLARRDLAFVHPKPGQVLTALSGGEPVNAADVFAIVIEEIARLQEGLRLGDLSAWQQYWNTDDRGRVVEPKIENVCRNVLLGALRERLTKYQIHIALPEVQRALNTRADVLIATWRGATLPIEAKRHNHPDLWTAASGQLQGYASDPSSTGLGVLVVFWFGTAWKATPARPDGKPAPKTPAELQTMLEDDLPPALRDTTAIFVLDLSDPHHTGNERRRASAQRRKAHPSRQRVKGASS